MLAPFTRIGMEPARSLMVLGLCNAMVLSASYAPTSQLKLE